ncbi:DnaA regulatory inactivator HdaA [Bartonella ancashensis]|uniref:Chromosomal replication initiator protein DnaA n=1 Tax=Bartonella ancashensis TaxID=1318743 RepID=A0A0M4LH17_9HYPH|nr:DnaA regulatory inactivator HdaA [Bartonella ancashensis]ALE03832.1 Chromosomal replication initiator protein DnaA [Bartonella ancashensis]
MKRCEMQLPLNFPYESIFQFDDLVITDSNRMAFQLIDHWPHWKLPFAILVGREGCGKTHFSSVWAQKANAIIINRDDIDQAISLASSGRSFLIEDIDTGEVSETGLFHLINSIKQANLDMHQATLLMTANTFPSTWNLKLNDLRSRLNSVMLVAINKPDDTLLEAVAFKLFSDRQIVVHSDIVHYLINRCERSLSSLRKIIDSIDKLALQRKSKITRAVVNEAINANTILDF